MDDRGKAIQAIQLHATSSLLRLMETDYTMRKVDEGIYESHLEG